MPEDPEALRAQLLGQLPSAEEIQAKQELLVSKQLPVGAMAKLLGKSVDETFALLTESPEFEVAAMDSAKC